jgi:hypothetical protein
MLLIRCDIRYKRCICFFQFRKFFHMVQNRNGETLMVRVEHGGSIFNIFDGIGRHTNDLIYQVRKVLRRDYKADRISNEILKCLGK